MLLLIQLIRTEDTSACVNTTFEQPYDGKTYRQIMRISQKGFEQYINQNMQYANTYIAQAIIPDISLNLGTMKMSLYDIVFSDSQFPDCNIQTNPDSNSLYFSMLGVNFTLQFQFQIQQQSYPYISDKGSGQIILQNAQITGDIHEYISQECQGAEQVNCSDFGIYINQLVITLQSPNSYIYNGILQLISSSLLQIFNTDLQETLQNAFLQVANQGIQSGELFAAPYGDQNTTVEDQRFVDIVVGQGYFDSMTMGTLCHVSDNVCTGSIQLSDDFPQPGSWGTNNDVQYLQSSDTYLSQFQVLYQQDLFDYKQNKQCDDVKFVNTGIIFRCYLQVEEQDIEVNFLASIEIYNVNIKQGLQELSIYEQINDFELVQGQVSDSVMQSVIEDINNVLKYNSPSINNGNFVNDKGCYYKRWTQWWMEVSCNFDGSFD